MYDCSWRRWDKSLSFKFQGPSLKFRVSSCFERDGDKEFIQFLSLAKGSCGELRAQLYVALDQEYIEDAEFASLRDLATEISRMISGLITYLKQSGLQGRKYR